MELDLKNLSLCWERWDDASLRLEYNPHEKKFTLAYAKIYTEQIQRNYVEQVFKEKKNSLGREANTNWRCRLGAAVSSFHLCCCATRLRVIWTFLSYKTCNFYFLVSSHTPYKQLWHIFLVILTYYSPIKVSSIAFFL